MNIKSILTEEQLAAVQAPPGVNLVLAIPGSGKTAVFAHRIAYLVESGVKPENILGLTFARKAALEIAARLKELIPASASTVTIGTFHSLCYRILRNEMSFRIIDDDEKIRIIKNIVSSKTLKPSLEIGEIIRTISLAKNNMTDIERFKDEGGHEDKKLVAIIELYQKGLEDIGAIDLDDLLLKAYRLLKDKPELMDTYQRKFHHVLCDESQDNNKVQLELLYLLSKPQDNLFLCADDDQAIHHFRGAEARHILELDQTYPSVGRYVLGNNFRSTAAILKVADNLIKNNSVRYAKELRTTNESGEEVQIIRASDEIEEARVIADEVECLEKEGQVAFEDVAILYRMNSMSLPFEDIFHVRGIPYELVSGNGFYSRREISSIINYLRVIKDPRDDEAILSILDVPLRYLGRRVRGEIQQFGADHDICCYEAMQTMRFSRMYQAKNIRELLLNLDYLREMPGLNAGDLISEVRASFKLDEYFQGEEIAIEDNSRIQNIEELQKKASEFKSLDDFLDYARKRKEQPSQTKGVKLLSMHASKGLEFSVVFIIGMNEGVLPHQRSINEKMVSEERRLCYVSMTRARHRLAMSYRVHQDKKSLQPSRFLKEAFPDRSF